MEAIDINQLTLFECDYNTPSLPPPYSYRYTIICKVNEGNEGTLAVNFNLNYTGREALKEEEILEEGFTLDDDSVLQANLPQVWTEEVKHNLKKSSWPKQQSKKKEGALLIKIRDSQGNAFRSAPDNVATWEYFLQEMIQAIYEVSKKEMPLEINFKEIVAGKAPVEITLNLFFSNRKLMVSSKQPSGQVQSKEWPWQELKRLLKTVYIPYYDPEKAITQIPDKPGKYIDVGEGTWYKFGEGANNPGKENNALERLEQQFRNLI